MAETDDSTLLDLINKRVGPAPSPQGKIGWSLWGLPVNQEAAQSFDMEKRKYDLAVQEAIKQLAPQALNPFRGATVGEVGSMSGHPLDTIATPQQYRDATSESPSLVPATRLHYTAAGEPPMGERLVPQAAQVQGPPNLVQPNSEDSGTMSGMQLQYPLGIKHTPMPVQLQGPPNPVRPEFYQREGDPLQTTTRQVDPQSAATLPQQMLGMSGLNREGMWPRANGSGNVLAKQAAVEQLVAAGHDRNDAIATVYGGEPLAGGIRAQNFGARTDASGARVDLLRTQTEGQQLKNDNYQRAADDIHETATTRVAKMRKQMEMDNQRNALQNELMTLDTKLKQAKLRGDSPDMKMAQEKLDLAKKKFQLLSAFIIANKSDVNPEAQALAEEMAAEAAGIIGDIHKQGLFERLFSEKPQVQRTPTGGSTQTVQPPATQPAQDTTQSDITGSINSMLQSRGVDAAHAQQQGVQYQGKMYTFKSGKWVPKE